MYSDIDTRALMSETKFYDGYSRLNGVTGKYETWNEAVERVMNMHRTFFKAKKVYNEELENYIKFAELAYKEKLVLGAQRALQFGGEQLFKHHMRMYNCVSGYCDRPEFFGEIMYILLCGAGAGFSVQFHHIAKLPKIAPRKKSAKIHVIEDSIEGWATAIDVLLSSFFVENAKYPEYSGHRVWFDKSKIRAKGSIISGGFKAPGPEPLMNALVKIEDLLIERSELSNSLRPIDAYDIVMHSANAVIAGGVRRSATICLFSKDDLEMASAKTGNWFNENPQRGRSNNSAVLVRDDTTKEEFDILFEKVRQFGEPGFIWTESTEHTYNPCVEIGMYPVLINPETGEKHSGWQGCVSGDTKLLTKNGIVNIRDSVGKTIEIWNGNKWSTVNPIQTGSDRKLYRVNFSDGSYLDATNNHKFLAKNRFEKNYSEYTTLELIELIRNSKYNIQIPRANVKIDENHGIEVHDAYDYGFILGDGHARPMREPFASVYANNINLPYPFVGGVKSRILYRERDQHNYYNVTFPNMDNNLAMSIKYDYGLPPVVFTWNKKSIVNFIAGWIDTDGTITKENSVRIYGREDKIRDLQLLLTKIGINSSVNLMQKAGIATNKAVRKQDVWYVQISNPAGLWTTKGKIEHKEVTKKGKNQLVVSIEELDGLHDSFCFEEPELHQGLFANVLTKQCNLVEGNGSKCNDVETFFRLCKAGAIMATLQAAYTDFKFMTDTTKKIFDREALIGVSITGWMTNYDVLMNPETQRKGAELIKEWNRKIAGMIGINPAARTTCVKPAGNAGVLLETASAAAGEHANRFLRTMQMNKQSTIAQLIRATNPYMVEESVWSTNKTDFAVMFPVIPKATSVFKKDLPAIKFLEIIKTIQNNWVEYGTDESLCVDKTVRHNVSNTVTVLEDEWESVREYIYENRDSFCGISLLAGSGDKDYNQAPMTEVKTPEELAELYGAPAFLASGLIVDCFDGFNDLWDAISTATYGDNGDREKADIRREWIRRFQKFADTYFEGDVKKTEYCLKDVYLLHKWTKIQNNFKNIDFSAVDWSGSTDIDTMAAAACAGGGCEL